jgi:hypothetical protein
MSLNRYEQRVFDYLQGHPEERHHWQQKFQTISKLTGDDHIAATQLDSELWRYYEERSGVVPVFKEAVRHEGLGRTSMRNLAELLLRLWTEPRPNKKKSPDGQ